MCVVLWYGMVLVAYPHDYPQTIHTFCGHRASGCRSPAPLSPFPLRRFMRMAANHLCGNGVSPSTPAFVPWSEQMSTHDLKTGHVGYCCTCVIHNFSSNQRIECPVNQARHRGLISVPPSCNKPTKGWYDAAVLLPFLAKMRSLVVDLVRETHRCRNLSQCCDRRRLMSKLAIMSGPISSSLPGQSD